MRTYFGGWRRPIQVCAFCFYILEVTKTFLKMDKLKIVTELKKYFKVQELVDKLTYQRWGESAWNFLDGRLLEVILILRRDMLKVPLVCNDWLYGGKNEQRGLRTNLSPLVKQKTDKNVLYLSQHCLGCAVDLVSSKMTAEDMRKLIVKNADKLPCKLRVEADVNWLHIDVMDDITKKDKVYLFKA